MGKRLKTFLVIAAALLWISAIVAFFWIMKEANSPPPKTQPGQQSGFSWGWLVPILVIIFWAILILAAVVIGRSSGQRKKWYIPPDQECEAIVYYLYQNEKILSAFLKNYKIWREKEKETLEIYKEREMLRLEIRAFRKPPVQKMERLKHGLPEQYFKLNMPCPFLKNNQCLIYEVRPLMCVAYYSVNPLELCNPLSTKMPKIKQADEIPFLYDRIFYYAKLDFPFFPLMPLGVYRIINEGYSYLSTIRGIGNIKIDAMQEPEIAAIKI